MRLITAEYIMKIVQRTIRNTCYGLWLVTKKIWDTLQKYWIFHICELWSGILDLWSGQKPWLTPAVNLGEFRRVQLANPLSSPPRWCPWVCYDAKEGVEFGKQREATPAIQSLVKLQLWFLSLHWKICFWHNCSLTSCACSVGPALGQNTLMI